MKQTTIRIMAAALAVSSALALVGCKSSADRMYECEAHGVSRDACYVAEQNRTSTLNAQAQAQAYRNAADLYGAKGTEVKKHHHKHHQQVDDLLGEQDDYE